MSGHQAIIREFSDMIDLCRGKVTFITEDGDRLVANSMLSALVGMATIVSVARTMSLQVECELPEDCQRITRFMKKYQLGQYRTEHD